MVESIHLLKVKSRCWQGGVEDTSDAKGSRETHSWLDFLNHGRATYDY